MARIVSFVLLVAILLLFAVLFFQVMADFFLPMFMALLLVVLFAPVHRWFQARCGRHERWAAVLTTTTIVLAFFLPASFILLRAGHEGANLYRKVVHREESATTEDEDADKAAEAKDAAKTPADQEPKGLLWASTRIAELGSRVGFEIKPAELKGTLLAKMEQYLTPVALSTGQFLLKLMVGAFVMIVSLYYFLADGPAMIRAIMRLLPLDDKYQAQLIDQFGNVTQAVVLAAFLSAVAQGVLAGIGFYFAGVGSVFLLTVLATLFAIVPFIGSAGVWVPVCLWIGFVDDRPWAAIILGVYCLVFVSAIDNVIKPLVLHGRSNIHPLLALLSVLGGVQALGPIGIIVGPMAVAFLQTLLEMINKEMVAMGKEKAVAAVPSAQGSK